MILLIALIQKHVLDANNLTQQKPNTGNRRMSPMYEVGKQEAKKAFITVLL
jgi:1,4-dihydroxy-2-naphthoate octaprenyltransferase